MRILNVFLESLLSESFPSLGLTVHLTFLGCPPTPCWSLDLLWGQLRFSPGPAPLCSCLQWPQLSELVRFSGGSAQRPCVSHRLSVCPADRVGLICSSYSRREGWGLPPQPHCPWVSAVVLFPPLHVVCPLGFAPEAALEGLGLPL